MHVLMIPEDIREDLVDQVVSGDAIPSICSNVSLEATDVPWTWPLVQDIGYALAKMLGIIIIKNK